MAAIAAEVRPDAIKTKSTRLLGSVIDIAESITHAEFLSAAFAPVSLSSVLRATAASRPEG
jgi:hypothetical protein